MNNLHVKTGDTAVVRFRQGKGKRGKILSVNPKKGYGSNRRCEHDQVPHQPAVRVKPAASSSARVRCVPAR